MFGNHLRFLNWDKYANPPFVWNLSCLEENIEKVSQPISTAYCLSFPHFPECLSHLVSCKVLNLPNFMLSLRVVSCYPLILVEKLGEIVSPPCHDVLLLQKYFPVYILNVLN